MVRNRYCSESPSSSMSTLTENFLEIRLNDNPMMLISWWRTEQREYGRIFTRFSHQAVDPQRIITQFTVLPVFPHVSGINDVAVVFPLLLIQFYCHENSTMVTHIEIDILFQHLKKNLISLES